MINNKNKRLLKKYITQIIYEHITENQYPDSDFINKLLIGKLDNSSKPSPSGLSYSGYAENQRCLRFDGDIVALQLSDDIKKWYIDDKYSPLMTNVAKQIGTKLKTDYMPAEKLKKMYLWSWKYAVVNNESDYVMVSNPLVQSYLKKYGLSKRDIEAQDVTYDEGRKMIRDMEDDFY